jgi:hypothetical protein
LINILTVFEPPSDAGDLDLDLGEDDFFTMLLRKLPLKDDHVDEFGGSTTPVSPEPATEEDSDEDEVNVPEDLIPPTDV